MPKTSIPHRLLPRAFATGRIVGQLGTAAARRLIRHTDADDALLGDALFDELDKLKGLAMKVGQVLSYMDVGLPEHTVARLAKLQKGAEPLPFELIRAEIETALAGRLDVLFDDFAPESIAAASVGQVHRATVGGVPVAVKVRYPHVRETFAADFKQIGNLGRIASLVGNVDGLALVEELRDRFLEECDYLREAAWQARFSTAFAGDSHIGIPQTVLTHCAENVLTSYWVDGDDFQAVCAQEGAARTHIAKTLMRFPYTSLLRHGVLHADPHPGNFVFQGDRVVVLDFGCVKRFEPADVQAWRHLTRVVVEDRRGDFREAICATGQVPQPEQIDFDDLWEMQCWLLQPYRVPHFHFSPEWWLRGQQYNQPTNRNLRYQAVPRSWIWFMRIQWGLHAVMCRLNASGDFRDTLGDCLDLPLTPMTDPSELEA